MGWQRSALFLAAGTCGVVSSSLFGGDPAAIASATTATAIAMTSSNAMLNIGSGFVQNGLQSSYESVVAAITGRVRTADGLPINHDLARAIRRSHLDAICYLVDGFEADSKDPYQARSHRPNQSRFIKAARAWIKAEHKLTEHPDFLIGASHESAIEEVRTVIENVCFETPESALGLIADEAKREAFEEFSAAMLHAERTIPSEFAGYFNGTSDLLPWSIAAQAFFAQRLKGDEKVRTVVFLERFNALGRGQADILSALEAVRSTGGDLAHRIAAVEQKIDAIISRMPEVSAIDQAGLASQIATAVAKGELVDQIVRQVILAQSRLHSVAQTAWQVQQRIDELTTRFFGREEIFSKLDAFADSRDAGILVLTAPAGSGKSACLANWVQRRRRTDPHLISHFISGKMPLTNGTGEITGHLAAQLSVSSGVGSETADVRGQNLFAALKGCPHPVTLVVDGLDEAATLLEPFVEAGACPPHVRIIVSARAAVDEWPNYLAVWRRLEQPEFAIDRINLAPLSSEESLLWLEDYIGDLPNNEMRELAAQLHRASDGLPLFFAFILEDLLTALPQAPTAEARQRLIRDVPAPFTDYIGHEMNGREPRWTSQERKLFGLLSVLKGPIAFDEITAIAADRYPDPYGLPHRLTRWLTISVLENRQIVSFAHPKLAEAFEMALDSTALEEEEKLLAWARKAWPRRGTGARSIAGSPYALDWLPNHLILSGECTEAGELLTNQDFLLERLTSETFAPQRLARHIASWFQLPETAWPDHGRHWNSAWVENESRLVHLAQSVTFVRPCLDRIVFNCLADLGVPQFWPPRARKSNPSRKQNLLRNQELAHSGAVYGVRPIGDRLVSWGADRAIRFWSNNGEPLSGGDDRSHAGRVRGVCQVGDRLVSWGDDGAIRFWSGKGEPMEGGDDQAHAGTIYNVQQVGERLVSCGDDGAIRFWSAKGEPMEGGDDQAHVGAVYGVCPVGDRLVSWGSDGAIRVWSDKGQPLPGGDVQAHSRTIMDVRQIGDRLVSWGNDGAIRFWSNKGQPLSGGDDRAHARAVYGVRPVGDRLVSWGDNGAIRFWSNHGEPLSGGDVQAHADWVRGVRPVGDRLVSWGADGAIRFWSDKGDRMSGGDIKAHAGWVRDVRPVGDRLVSCGDDGAIRFWSAKGEPMEGGADQAHVGAVYGVWPMGDRLVSWGDDGAIRFWSENGEPLPKSDDQAHLRIIIEVRSIGDRLVSWSDDGAIRFWSNDGERILGGDDKAHVGCVRDVRLVGDRLVSWGDDGAIRFWSNQGERLLGGADRAHAGCVRDVRPVGDRLVSWGDDAAIRFWSNHGEPLSGRHHQAHAGEVYGVQPVGDRLVSWGGDGVVQFWSDKGEPLSSKHAQAHAEGVYGVQPVGDRLVSWGGDGAMRFWSDKGEPLSGGDDQAHAGGIRDIRQIGDRLISWGDDGAIRFWSNKGEPLSGGDDQAHAWGLRGVCQVGDKLVSWDSYGGIRFWSDKGEPLSGGDNQAHAQGIRDVQPVGDGLVSWGGDRTLQFWSDKGEPLGGGDDQEDARGINGVRSVGDRLVSWGDDGAIRFWNSQGILDELIVVPGGICGQVYADHNRLFVPGRTLWIYDVQPQSGAMPRNAYFGSHDGGFTKLSVSI